MSHWLKISIKLLWNCIMQIAKELGLLEADVFTVLKRVIDDVPYISSYLN